MVGGESAGTDAAQVFDTGNLSETLHYGDVTPVSDGTCRLHPQFARAVVAACRVPQERLNEHVRWLLTAF